MAAGFRRAGVRHLARRVALGAVRGRRREEAPPQGQDAAVEARELLERGPAPQPVICRDSTFNGALYIMVHHLMVRYI